MNELGENIDQNVVMWSAIVGTLIPILIAAILKMDWSQQLKGVVSFVVCVIAAGVTATLAGEVDTTDYVTSILIVLTQSQVMYQHFYKPSLIAPSIQRNINP